MGNMGRPPSTTAWGSAGSGRCLPSSPPTQLAYLAHSPTIICCLRPVLLPSPAGSPSADIVAMGDDQAALHLARLLEAAPWHRLPAVALLRLTNILCYDIAQVCGCAGHWLAAAAMPCACCGLGRHGVLQLWSVLPGVAGTQAYLCYTHLKSCFRLLPCPGHQPAGRH